jgi:hypothetical protein
MTQQLAIIVLVDVGTALTSKTLDGNTYLFDNMQFHGSTGEGTGELVTAINGSYWQDGSQGTEEVLNWLPYSLGSIPPTLPRGYHAERSRQSDERALADLRALAEKPLAGAEAANEVNRIHRGVGHRVKATGRAHGATGQKLLDVTGAIVTDIGSDTHSYPGPVITDIRGQAVDEKIMYPSEYGSPDLVTDGWYWSATVDTSRPGTYSYTMQIQLHDLVQEGGEWHWEPVTMTCESQLRIITEPRRNGFTKAGMGVLPIAVPAPQA